MGLLDNPIQPPGLLGSNLPAPNYNWQRGSADWQNYLTRLSTQYAQPDYWTQDMMARIQGQPGLLSPDQRSAALRDTMMGIIGSVGGGDMAMKPGKLVMGQKGDPGYVYHATNSDRVYDIADSGYLNTHAAHEFTDQDVWPDGSTEKRNYFSPSPEHSAQFAPEEGTPALLRMKRDATAFKTERGTGDIYSTNRIPTASMEYLGEDGGWYPMGNLKSGQ